MAQRYIIRLRSRKLNGTPYGVSEIWRISDDTKVHEEWSVPVGPGPEEAARIMRLLEAAPDDQAEAIIKDIEWERQKAAVNKLPGPDEW